MMLWVTKHTLDSFFVNYDSDDPQPWSRAVQMPATIGHVLAILATIFRLLYRWRLSRYSWDDAWATLALMCDIGCLASIWMQVAPKISHLAHQTNHKSNWILSLTITSIVWFARMSILSSVVRIANPTPRLRLVAFGIGAMFIAMEAGLIAQKIYICIHDLCRITAPVAIAQLATDIVSDVILVAMPIRFLRDVRLHRARRILILSAFSASMLITLITIPHSLLLFQEVTNATFIIAHVKAALALFVCNALVLVTFAYRLCRMSCPDLECCMAGGSMGSSTAAQFSSVIDLPSKLSTGVTPATAGIQSSSH